MGAAQEGGGEGEAPEMGDNEASPESRSFDFERTAPVEIQPPRAPTPNFTPPPVPVAAPVPAPVPMAVPVSTPAPTATAPAPAHEPRPEWTPAPPSDATREGPRSEP